MGTILDLFRGSNAQRIARRYMKELRSAGETRQMAHVPAERAIVVFDDSGTRSQVLFLGNLEREIESASETDHEDIYRRYVASHIELAGKNRTTDYAAVAPTLRFLLKDQTYPAYIALQSQVDLPGSEPSKHVYEPVVGDVIACAVMELSNRLQFVTEDDLAKWGVSAEQVLKDTRENICALACEVHSSGHTHYVFADDSFQAARLVNTALFKDRPARGAWVAVVPDRNTYFLTESDDMEGLSVLARLVDQQFEAGDRLISGMPFVMRNGAWHVFEPPQEVRVLFDNVARRYAALQWMDYKAVLEKQLQRQAEDVFVASLKVYKDQNTPAYSTRVVWSKDTDTILPEADRVTFFEDDGLPLRVAAWADVRRVMGSSMRELPGFPVRYRVNAFPSAVEFVAMGARTE